MDDAKVTEHQSHCHMNTKNAELLNMAAERCKYATFLPRCSEKTTGSNVFKIGGNNALRLCLLQETHFKRIYAKEIMQN